MAYIKYKELTKNFYFYNQIDKTNIPAYASVYLMKDESVLNAYQTKRDIALITNKRIILFDEEGLGKSKETTIIPFKSVSSSSIHYKSSVVSLLLFMDSGYPVTLKFIKQTPDGKKALRITYQYINELIC